jgi:hypothetical protein
MPLKVRGNSLVLRTISPLDILHTSSTTLLSTRSKVDCQQNESPLRRVVKIAISAMDPFTISTGVAGLLSLAMEITKILSAYISDVKSAPEDAQNILTNVTSLSYVLEQLVQFLRKDATKTLGKFECTSALRMVINSCQTQVQDLYQKLEQLQIRSDSKVKGFIDRVKWPFRTEEYQSTVATQFVQIFQFSLQISNW